MALAVTIGRGAVNAADATRLQQLADRLQREGATS